jgi:hypothetical protein
VLACDLTTATSGMLSRNTEHRAAHHHPTSLPRLVLLHPPPQRIPPPLHCCPTTPPRSAPSASPRASAPPPPPWPALTVTPGSTAAAALEPSTARTTPHRRHVLRLHLLSLSLPLPLSATRSAHDDEERTGMTDGLKRRHPRPSTPRPRWLLQSEDATSPPSPSFL